MGCIFIGLPIWYAIGILITFSPEFAKALEITGTMGAGDAVMFSYIGLAVGDLVQRIHQVKSSDPEKKSLQYLLLLTLAFVCFLSFPSG